MVTTVAQWAKAPGLRCNVVGRIPAKKRLENINVHDFLLFCNFCEKFVVSFF
jgi:hypothetical protein